MAYRIRAVTLQDIEILVAQRSASLLERGHAPADVRKVEGSAHGWFTDHLQDGTFVGWLVEAGDDQIVAGAGMWLMDWLPSVSSIERTRAHIFNVYTEPAYRRQGLARKLMQQCLDECSARGITIVSLHASETGKLLYDTMGFQPSSEMRIKLPVAAEQAEK